MAQTEQLSLSWDSHQKSICNGLSLLQQRGEFVDMTLAADGHHVKVHQMVMSLVSPYIKDLISTAQCPHPIIFLNNISYTTLCAILEYIYTGEVLVSKHKLSDLIAAGKALHIRGLREMDDQETIDPITESNGSPSRNTFISEKLRAHKEKKKMAHTKEEKGTAPVPICKVYLDETNSTHEDSTMDILDDTAEICETSADTSATLNDSSYRESDVNYHLTPEETRKTLLSSRVQYTVSNQGGLQSIYNRYMYQLRYISKKNRKRSWRCVDYNSTQCPANMFTDENDQVTDRTFTHNHPFHDHRIQRKNRIVSQKVQYTVSNQGGLQAIYNRYIYHLRYIGKKNRKRFWRCIDYSSNLKCPANICTDENNQVTERSFTHNHAFHDNKILKKLRIGIIYSIFQQAENRAGEKKRERRVPVSTTAHEDSE